MGKTRTLSEAQAALDEFNGFRPLQITDDRRKTSPQGSEPCLRVALAQNHLVDNQAWELREDLRFSAAQAEFVEL